MIQSYREWKLNLGVQIGMSEDLIHVHVGLTIFVLAALLLRRRMRSWIPVGVVIGLALLNEVIDYVEGMEWELASSSLDFLNTILWPTVLFLLARRVSGRSVPADG